MPPSIAFDGNKLRISNDEGRTRDSECLQAPSDPAELEVWLRDVTEKLQKSEQSYRFFIRVIYGLSLASLCTLILWLISFKIRIDVKDQKYRITYSDVIMMFDAGSKPIEKANTKSLYPKVTARLNEITQDLHNHLMTREQDDNW